MNEFVRILKEENKLLTKAEFKNILEKNNVVLSEGAFNVRLSRLRQKGLLLDIGDTIAYLDPEVLDKIKILETLKDKSPEEIKNELVVYKSLFNKISKYSKVKEILSEVLI